MSRVKENNYVIKIGGSNKVSYEVRSLCNVPHV